MVSPLPNERDRQGLTRIGRLTADTIFKKPTTQPTPAPSKPKGGK